MVEAGARPSLLPFYGHRGDPGAPPGSSAAGSPAEAKRLGRDARGFDPPAWRRHRFDIVARGNAATFGQDEVLAGYLRSTGDAVLVEASPDDRVWGVGRALDDPAAADPRRWDGENLLGFALMAVRDGLGPAA